MNKFVFGVISILTIWIGIIIGLFMGYNYIGWGFFVTLLLNFSIAIMVEK